jgi:hypothetical protein
MSDKKSPGVLERLSKAGAVREKRVGVSATLKAGDDIKNDSVTWNVVASSIGDTAPAVGDRLRDASQTWWTITAVAAIADGVFPCSCSKVKE